MIVDKTRELVIKAKLYVLYNETPPIANGYYSSVSTTRDPENSNPINRNNQQDRAVSLGGKKYNLTPSFFSNVAPLLNGHLPPVNIQIGAPRCTFTYGGIEPGVAHPQYNLLKGPSEQYSPNFVDKGLQIVELVPVVPQNPDISIPSMPFSTNNPFGANKVLTTYNIWALVDSSGNLLTSDSKKWKGQITNPVNGEPEFKILPDNNGESSIQLSSPNSKSTIKRIFPLSKDVIYDTDSTLYAVKSVTDSKKNVTRTIIPQKVTERGAENNSFNLSIGASFTPSNQNGKESIIIITIGYASAKLNNVAYQIEISPVKSEFYLITAQGQKLKQRFNLPVNQFEKTQQNLDLYMHFLKDIALIGFSPDPNSWENLSPVSQQKNSDSVKNKFINFLPSDATITIQCNYASCVVKYGALAFNNFDANFDDHRPHVTFTHDTSRRARSK